MAADADAPLDLLWKEYGLGFRDFDDLTLARWLAQTLGQLEGKAWRFSHPLLGAYRLAAQLAHQRQVWLKLLVTPPAAYARVRVLPGADAAAADPRRARDGADLPALQRDARAF